MDYKQRLLKFRAWDMTHKKMLDRVLAGPGDPCSIVWDEDRKDWLNFDCACGVIMQFTGHKDKHNKDIYEKDIVCNDHGTGWIEWDNDMSLWRVQSFAWWCEMYKFEDAEVLGNIYENSELLNG